MSTELARREPLTMNKLQIITSIAPAMYKSRMFGVQSEDQAIGVMIKGDELGFGLAASFEFIKPISTSRGTIPTLTPKGMMALILSSSAYGGHKIEEKRDAKGNPDSCTVTMRRVRLQPWDRTEKIEFEFTVTFTMKDAERAGLVKDGGAWQTYPANMLRWRAIGYCADQVFPDVIGGLHRIDEFGMAITADGDVIEGSWSSAAVDNKPAQPDQETQVRPPDPAATLNALVQAYGAEAVMVANEGKIPTTLEEMERVRDKLAQPDVTNVQPLEY